MSFLKYCSEASGVPYFRKLLQSQDDAKKAALEVLAGRQGFSILVCSTGLCTLQNDVVKSTKAQSPDPKYATAGLQVFQFCSGSVNLVSLLLKLSCLSRLVAFVLEVQIWTLECSLSALKSSGLLSVKKPTYVRKPEPESILAAFAVSCMTFGRSSLQSTFIIEQMKMYWMKSGKEPGHMQAILICSMMKVDWREERPKVMHETEIAARIDSGSASQTLVAFFTDEASFIPVLRCSLQI